MGEELLYSRRICGPQPAPLRALLYGGSNVGPAVHGYKGEVGCEVEGEGGEIKNRLAAVFLFVDPKGVEPPTF